MKIAILSPIAWRTPPRHYGPWELMAYNTAEGLIKQGFDVTLFATLDSLTSGKLSGICPLPYEENKDIDPKVWEALHISTLMEKSDEFDLIHNHYDFLPLTYSKLISTPIITTIHGFSSSKILPVYQKYNSHCGFISISNSDRDASLNYLKTVYNGINMNDFEFQPMSKNYLLFFGRIHPDKGTADAITIAKESGYPLIIAGIIQDNDYFEQHVKPHLKDPNITYIGSVGPKERSTLLGQAYALLHPIHFDEPFGLSVAESMACGTPVIAYNKGAMPELIENEKTGYLVNSLEEAIAAVPKIKNLSPYQCRKRVEINFSVDKMVSDYIQVYDHFLCMSSKIR